VLNKAFTSFCLGGGARPGRWKFLWAKRRECSAPSALQQQPSKHKNKKNRLYDGGGKHLLAVQGFAYVQSCDSGLGIQLLVCSLQNSADWRPTRGAKLGPQI